MERCKLDNPNEFTFYTTDVVWPRRKNNIIESEGEKIKSSKNKTQIAAAWIVFLIHQCWQLSLSFSWPRNLTEGAGKEEMRRNMSRGDGEAELIVISVSVCPGQEQAEWGDVDGHCPAPVGFRVRGSLCSVWHFCTGEYHWNGAQERILKQRK